MNSLAGRIVGHVRRKGLKATAGEILRVARERAFLDERHIWYAMSLGADRPGAALPEGLRFFRVDLRNIPVLYGVMDEEVVRRARQRLEDGHELWVAVVDGVGDGEWAFTIWVYHGAVPVIAAAGGEVSMPAGTVCFEDALTSPDYRGRGMILPGACAVIAEHLEGSGVKEIITKVEADNRTMRLAIRRCGFREIATMHHQRTGLRRMTGVKTGTSSDFDWLLDELSG